MDSSIQKLNVEEKEESGDAAKKGLNVAEQAGKLTRQANNDLDSVIELAEGGNKILPLTQPIETDAFFMEDLMKQQYENSINGWQPGDSIPQKFYQLKNMHVLLEIGDQLSLRSLMDN